MWTYRANAAERPEIGFFVHSPPQAVATWLRDNWKAPTGSEYSKWDIDDHGRRVLEFIASRRSNPLINYAIARYGYSINAIQRAYDKGDTSTRHAALANPRGNHLLRDAAKIVKSDRASMAEALLSNRHLPGEFLENLFLRQGDFANLSDTRLLMAAYLASRCARLTADYDGYFDGWAEYSYSKVFTAIWSLALTVPTTTAWASALAGLFKVCNKPPSFDRAEEALKRWRVDDAPKKPGDTDLRLWGHSMSFHVRSRLAELIKDDETLRSADDLALRVAFYRRFPPWKYNDWTSWLEMDGTAFVESALDNPNLWSAQERRRELQQVCWAAPDPRSDMDLPNLFMAMEKRFRVQHPEWFRKGDEEGTPNAVLDAIASLREIVEQIASRPRGLFG